MISVMINDYVDDSEDDDNDDGDDENQDILGFIFCNVATKRLSKQ